MKHCDHRVQFNDERVNNPALPLASESEQEKACPPPPLYGSLHLRSMFLSHRPTEWHERILLARVIIVDMYVYTLVRSSFPDSEDR